MNAESEYISFRVEIPAEFSEVFSHFYVAQNPGDKLIQRTLIPSYQTIMVFSFGTPIEFTSPGGTTLTLVKVLALGPIKAPLNYTLPPNVDMLVANFKSDGFYRFFKQSSVDQNAPVNPDDLLDEDCFTSLWARIKELSTEERVQTILEFARPYLRTKDATITQLEQYANKAVDTIKSVAQSAAQSERNIQIKHKKLLGFSAKELNRYQRFLTVLNALHAGAETSSAKIDWQSYVVNYGYYDQSQLIHDFKHYLNLSPTQYLEFHKDICA